MYRIPQTVPFLQSNRHSMYWAMQQAVTAVSPGTSNAYI